MGEVYRARDAKLNRQVAIKVLPDRFAGDAARVRRLHREAQLLASLNHPQIATIHGLEESNGICALVMELVEGEDLKQRIARGPMPIGERCRSSGKSRTRSTRRTARASCIATSSLPTSSFAATAP